MRAGKSGVRCRIVLELPPPGVDFGLQSGSGPGYTTVQKQRSGVEDLCFDFTLNVKPGKDGFAVFSGPFVQGPAGAKFIYIDIGGYAGQSGAAWSRRLKIPLKGIELQNADPLSVAASVFEARVKGTAKDGSPNCGTVNPFTGWMRVSA